MKIHSSFLITALDETPKDLKLLQKHQEAHVTYGNLFIDWSDNPDIDYLNYKQI